MGKYLSSGQFRLLREMDRGAYVWRVASGGYELHDHGYFLKRLQQRTVSALITSGYIDLTDMDIARYAITHAGRAAAHFRA